MKSGRAVARLVVLLGTVGICTVGAESGAWAMDFSSPQPCPTIRYHSAPSLDAQRACMNLGAPSRGAPRGTYLFLSPGGSNGDGAGIFQDNGALVWWQPAGGPEDHDMAVVHFRGQPYLALWSGRWTRAGNDRGDVSLYNEHYRRVGVITAGRPFRPDEVDLHEFRITPQGDALIGIWDPVTTMVGGHPDKVVQYVVQKLSLVRDSSGIHTGRVLFQWNSLRDVPVSQSHQGDPLRLPWDYFHGNAVAQDTDGNLLVSSRNTWGIYKVSVKTGHVIWEVGAKRDDRLKEPWCDQHDISALGHRRYSLFDDGASGPGCEVGHGGHASRGLIFRVIPSSGRARVRLLRAYGHNPPIYADWMGSMQRLGSGRVLIDWGTTPEVTEYGVRSRRVALDLSLSNASYRGFRFTWDGKPKGPPAVAASLHSGGGTDVWASWNGSTEVTAWRVLAGPSPSLLAPVGGPVPKRGFETAMLLSRTYAAVAVEALDVDGRVLATSKTVASDAT